VQGSWGGTSFGAAQLNGAAAVIDQSVGHRVGLWNPAIYGFAASGRSPFTPLSAAGTGNDNLYYTGTPASATTRARAWATRTWSSWRATSASGPRGPAMPDT
jgi:subtilase family serine protease